MAEQKYAILDSSNVVTNIILWDDKNVYTPPEGHTVQRAPDRVSIGWTRTVDSWTKPTPAAEPTPPVEDAAILTERQEAITELTNMGMSLRSARRIVNR